MERRRIEGDRDAEIEREGERESESERVEKKERKSGGEKVCQLVIQLYE